jgi:hypothetical protein
MEIFKKGKSRTVGWYSRWVEMAATREPPCPAFISLGSATSAIITAAEASTVNEILGLKVPSPLGPWEIRHSARSNCQDRRQQAMLHELK